MKKAFYDKKGPGGWHVGRVERVVPGKLVYVGFSPKDEPRAFKLDSLLIRQSNGTFSNYAGEPFSQLGLAVGSSVAVVSVPGHPAQANLVFDPFKSSHTGFLGSSLKSVFGKD